MTQGEKFLTTAAEHIDEDYVYGSLADFTDPNFKGPWDCAEFISWVVYQVTGKVFGCEPSNNAPLKKLDPYTGAWQRDLGAGILKDIGVKEAIKTPGAILLRYSANHHIVFSDGQGGTIEAMGKNYGVCRGDANEHWDYGIMVPE